MKSRVASVGAALAIVAGLGQWTACSGSRRRVKRNFEAEIRIAAQSAKTAAGVKTSGSRTARVLPQSGGEDTPTRSRIT